MQKFVVLTFWLYLFAVTAQATDYHVCSNGSDSNDGLSHDTAWETYAKANSKFGSLDGGDSILFCSGEEFVAGKGARWTNYNSTRDDRVTISSYTHPESANSGYPTIYSANESAFKIEDGGNADHDEGYVISKLVLKGGGNHNGIFIYNDADFIDIIDVEIFDFSIGIQLAGSNAPNSGSDKRNSDLIVRRAYVHDNGGQGFLGGGDNLLIEDSVFVNNGFDRAVFNHNIYLSGSGGAVSNEVVRNNKLYRSTMIGGECSGVSLVAHGDHTNLLIENNVIWEDVGAVTRSCWGIALDNGHGGADLEQFPSLIIRGNTVVNTGNMLIGCAVCRDVTIEDNVIVHQNAFAASAIVVPDRNENYAILPKSNRVVVRNNSILFDSTGKGASIRLGSGDGAIYTSKGNSVYKSAGSGLSGCGEAYNTGDEVNASDNVCLESIPQALLDSALAKTVLTRKHQRRDGLNPPHDVSILE